jgi:hypothetical protein
MIDLALTYVHQILGEERIKAICEKYDLHGNNQKIVDEILVQWEKHLGDSSKKALVALEKTSGNPKREQILLVIFEITHEFLAKRVRDISNLD